MLPIRLGMANADGDQDLLVYAFSKKGKVECTNYRTVPMPTGKNVPLFVQKNFGEFFTPMFFKTSGVKKANYCHARVRMDVSPKNFMKCDPCVATAPSAQDLVQAGVWWITRDWNDYSDVNNNDEYADNVFFTRLHVRYNRNAFPQDLFFR